MAYFYIASTEAETHLVTNLDAGHLLEASEQSDFEQSDILHNLSHYLLQFREDVGLQNGFMSLREYNDEVVAFADIIVSILHKTGTLMWPTFLVGDEAQRFPGAAQVDLPDNAHVFLVIGRHFPHDGDDISQQFVGFHIYQGPDKALSSLEMRERIDTVTNQAIERLGVHGLC